MGAICSYYRENQYSTGLNNNIIIMFIAGASTTFFWLLLRKHFLRYTGSSDGKLLNQ